MPQSSRSTPAGQIRISTNPNFKELFDDFADYQGVKPFRLASDLVNSHHDIVEAFDLMTLDQVWAEPQRILPGYLRTISGAVITVHANPTSLESMVINAARLHQSVTWVARAALYHGLAAEVEAERFTVTPIL